MKVRARELSDKTRIEVLDTLYTAAGAVRGRDAMKLFLRDLLTTSERIMLGRRIIIARKLIAGETHRKIEQDMKVGRIRYSEYSGGSTTKCWGTSMLSQSWRRNWISGTLATVTAAHLCLLG